MQQATNILAEAQDLCYVLVSFSFTSMTSNTEGRSIIVCIATRYGLEGPRSNPSEGENFRTCQASHTMGTGFSRGKAAGAWLWPFTSSNAKVKERVELYIYSLSGTSWSFLGRNLPLFYHFMTTHIKVGKVQSLKSEKFILNMLYNFCKVYNFCDYISCLPKVKRYWKEGSGIDSFSEMFPSGSALNLRKVFIVVFQSF